MALFGFGKKKAESKVSCCCEAGSVPATDASTIKASGTIKVLGSGCKKCNDLENATREALAELRIDEDIEHVTDFAQIAAYGVMTTPALIVDGKVVSYGKILKKEEVVDILKKVRG